GPGASTASCRYSPAPAHVTASTAGTVAGRLPMTAVLQEASYRRLSASGLVRDRMPRGRVLTIAQSTGVVASLALAIIFASGGGRYGVLVAFEVLFGLVWALDFPARRTSLYALLGAPRVAQAVSLET